MPSCLICKKKQFSEFLFFEIVENSPYCTKSAASFCRNSVIYISDITIKFTSLFHVPNECICALEIWFTWIGIQLVFHSKIQCTISIFICMPLIFLFSMGTVPVFHGKMHSTFSVFISKNHFTYSVFNSKIFNTISFSYACICSLEKVLFSIGTVFLLHDKVCIKVWISTQLSPSMEVLWKLD